MQAVTLLLDGSLGIYIPQTFATDFDTFKFGVFPEWVLTALRSGPDHEVYNEAWAHVLDNAKFYDGDDEYTLYQDGDLWVLCAARMTEDELQHFGMEG